jgi:hypothetical protein
LKKLFVLTAAVSILAAAAFPQTLSLALRGGAGYASGGDLSSGLGGLMDYYSAEYSSLTGKHSFSSLGWTAGAELLLHLGPRWALGLGAGYERHGRESIVGYELGALQVQETLSPVIQAIPVTGNVHFLLPLGGKLALDLHVGAGAYFARLDWSSSYALSVLGYDGTDDFTFQADRVGFGGQAGAALEWALSSSLSLCLRVEGRYVRISGFQGDWTETGAGDLWSFSESGQGTLYYYDWTAGGATYAQVVIQSALPEGSAVSNAREARVELTGFAATAGIKIRFF